MKMKKQVVKNSAVRCPSTVSGGYKSKLLVVLEEPPNREEPGRELFIGLRGILGAEPLELPQNH